MDLDHVKADADPTSRSIHERPYAASNAHLDQLLCLWECATVWEYGGTVSRRRRCARDDGRRYASHLLRVLSCFSLSLCVTLCQVPQTSSAFSGLYRL